MLEISFSIINLVTKISKLYYHKAFNFSITVIIFYIEKNFFISVHKTGVLVAYIVRTIKTLPKN